MQTPISERFGMEYAIFGFSHCRDVVAAVSRAGGMGVLGAAMFTPEQLELELRWLDENAGGKPYGVDVVMPAGYATVEATDDDELVRQYEKAIPEKHWEFVEGTLERLKVPPLPEDAPRPQHRPGWNAEVARQHIDMSFEHETAFLVNALGPPPPDVIERAHDRGIPIGAMAGKPEHAVKHVEQGVDVIVCQGNEAGGHTGSIGTMVLVPDVVDAVGPDVPVLAAGGIATGRQIAASLALGAQGAWLGSVWLTTIESDVDPGVKQQYLQSKSSDTVRTRENSGKPSRGLRNGWRDAWLAEHAPGTLPMPLQGILTEEAKERIKRAKRYDLMHASVGQVVGRMNQERSVHDVIFEMVEDYIGAVGRMAAMNPA